MEKRTKADEYRELMGHDPPDPGDHPLAEQWTYKGSREERARLAAELGETPEQPELIDGQGTLL